jgi:nitroimidazol reductase NimA-like FMN-containing flavoprotein (pyridoxamine 5'-phosphate oxidase superfamily)
MDDELAQRARDTIDGNRYMTIGTVDEDGHPWVTPVYFCPDGYRKLYWISRPDAQHSLNIAKNPAVTIVVFDSSVPIGAAEAVYMQGSASGIAEPSDEQCAAAFRPRFEGVKAFTPDELRVTGLRLYRADISRHWILIRGDDPVWGRGTDARIEVSLSDR